MWSDDTNRMMRANQQNWDARTPVHVASAFYGLDGRRSPSDWFAAFEWADLGALAGLDVLHLQCHLGTETLAFSERGARAVGLDFSAASVAAARDIADRAGADVEYVRANAYDARAALGDRTFDVVYTGKGALCYLPDLPGWARVVADLLRPGGRVYVVEFHPVFNALGPKPPRDEGEELLLRYDCADGGPPVERDATYTYTDGPALTEGTVAYEWMHGVGAAVTALVTAGLELTSLRESDLLPWPRWPRMVMDESGWWRLPDTDPKVPLLYALLARKPLG